MLLFYCTPESELEHLRRKGLSSVERPLFSSDFEATRTACAGALLVIDPTALDGGRGGARIEHIPPSAFLNLDPYRPPAPATAAGGYVMRRSPQEYFPRYARGAAGGALELLLIFRRGVWDLPKGKQDTGESIEACALREVREEVGATALHLECPLGTTVHGYPDRGYYRVKTTHWFLMTTPETDFTPQKEEDIERIAWMPWTEARRCVGYETLRRHMAGLDPVVLERNLS